MAEHEWEREERAPVIGLFGPEALIARRIAAQQRLGKASIVLNEANLEYNACINEIIEINTALRGQQVDTDALVRALQADASPDTAVGGYGRYDG